MSCNRCNNPERHWLERLCRFDNERLHSTAKQSDFAHHWDAHWIAKVANFDDDDEDDDRYEDGTSTEGTFREQHLTQLPKPASSSEVRPRPVRSKTDKVARVLPCELAWTVEDSWSSDESTPAPVRARRHGRSASAPQLKPAQELHVNTFLPLKLPPKELTAKSPLLTYPTSWWPEDVENDDTEDWMQQSRARSHWDRDEMHRVDSSASFFSTVSDGSYHGDAGDENPEDQLANAIQQQHCQVSTSTKSPTVLVQSPFDVKEEGDSDEEGEAIREQGGYMHHVASFLLSEPSPAPALPWAVERPKSHSLSSLSPPSPSPYATNGRLRSQSADGANLDDILQHDRRLGRFLPAPPSQLSAEVQDRRSTNHGQPPTAHRNRPSNLLSSFVSWLLPSIEEDEAPADDNGGEYDNVDSSSSTGLFRNRWATSFMSLPSLLSPTESLPSLSNGSSVVDDYDNGPPSPSSCSSYSAEEDEEEDTAPRPFGQVKRTHSGFGLSTYADETPNAFCDTTICGRSDAAQMRRAKEQATLSASKSSRQRGLMRRNNDIVMRMTPAADVFPQQKTFAPAHHLAKATPPSPLWDERLDPSPYQRSWSSVLNLP